MFNSVGVTFSILLSADYKFQAFPYLNCEMKRMVKVYILLPYTVLVFLGNNPAGPRFG